MKYYHSAGRRGPYFEGWYLKFQTRNGKAVALIPAIHMNDAGRRSASLQVISDSGTWWLDYAYMEFHASKTRFQIQVGQCFFTDDGAWLNVEHGGLSLHGTLRYGPFTPLKTDIMGPFRFLPGMECSHGVISMAHPVEGRLTLNGEIYDFSGGRGYVETDRGRSFPDKYLWTQCSWQTSQRNCLMLSIATIPLAMGSFTGCICAVLYQGQEYRLATYRGVRIERWSGEGALICQGKYRLEVQLLEGQGQPLRAPKEGNMRRTIHESLSAGLRYRFWAGKELLFDHTDPHGSFEYTGGNSGRS